MSSNSTWTQKGLAWLFIVFCIELGLFLLVYPWTDRWQVNLIPALLPQFRSFWDNGYFRGGISGVGLLNLWIALTEVFRLNRFSPPRPHLPN